MLSIGTDIVENKRVEEIISDAFISKTLSQEEIKIYKEYKDKRVIQFVCGRWAAKEAIIKCLSGYEIPLMTDLTILNDVSGKPYINYKNISTIERE